MRKRQIVTVNPSEFIHNIIKRHILSELSDIEFTKAESGNEALELIQHKEFEIVIVYNDPIDMNALILFEKLNNLSIKKKPTFVFLTDIVTTKNKSEIKNAGIEHYLQVPFTASEIIGKVNSICNPKSWRIHDRFHIPDAKVFLHTAGSEIEIKLINISYGGILCELLHNNLDTNFMGISHINIFIPAPKGYFQIKALRCKLSRLNVTSWKSDDTADSLQITFLFTNLTAENKHQLNQTIELAKDNIIHRDKN